MYLCRGPPRFEGERRFGGDRDGYRGGPRGPGGEFGGEKGGAPADYRPSFGVILLVYDCFIAMKCEIYVSVDLVNVCYVNDSVNFVYLHGYG
jgi:hypothetical protein